MTKAADLTGQHFGRLTVIRRHFQNNVRQQAMWECVCSCENQNVVIVPTTSLRKEITRSCGCLRKETNKERNQKHGLASTAEYRVWCGIKNRCYNEKEKSYSDYGGRGITMCDEWKESFEAFYRDIGQRPSPEHTIERNDNNLGYSKENCRWATRKEQAGNRRTTTSYALGGEEKSLTEWCHELGLNYNRVYYRLKNGLSFEEAISLIEYSAITYDEMTLSLNEWCELLDLKYSNIYPRLLRGEQFGDMVRE